MSFRQRHHVKQVFLLVATVLLAGHSVPSAWSSRPLPNPDPNVLTLTLNDIATLDIEAIVWPDGSISLPVKYLGNILDISTQQAHQDHTITFEHPKTHQSVQINPESQQITQNAQPIADTLHPLIYTAHGFYTDDDIYVDATLLQHLLGVEMSLDKDSQSIEITIDHPVKALIEAAQDNVDPDKPLSIEDRERLATKPIEENLLLESIDIKLNGNNYQTSSSGGESLSNTFGTLALDLTGEAFKHPYKLTPIFAFYNGSPGISSATGLMTWDSEKHITQAGTINVGLSDVISPLCPLIGVEWSSKNAQDQELGKQRQKSFTGPVDTDGKVDLVINGTIIQSQMTKDKAYHFDSVDLKPNALNEVRVVLTTEDGAEKTLQEERIPNFEGFLLKGEKAYSVFAGRVPYQFQLPGIQNSEYSGLTLPQSNKWIAGARYFQGLSERLTFGVSTAGDTILGSPKTSRYSTLYTRVAQGNLARYTSYFRDSNLLSGQSFGSTLTYRMGSRWTLHGDIGVSSNTNYSPDPIGENSGTLARQISLGYNGENRSISATLYHYDNGYYTPFGLGDNNLFDRKGLIFQATGSLLGFRYNTMLDEGELNLDEELSGGSVGARRWNVSLGRKLGKHISLDASSFGIQGRNNDAFNAIENHQVRFSYQLPKQVSGDSTIRQSSNRLLINPLYPSQVVSLLDSDAQVQTYWDNTIRIPLGRSHTLNLASSFNKQLNYVTLQTDFRIGPVQFQPIFQKSIGGEQTLSNIGLGLTYELPNGLRIGLRYNYNSTSLSSLNSLFGDNRRLSHQLYFDFSDTLVHVGKQFLSVNNQSRNAGYLKGEVFLDKNLNGQRDPGEPPVGDVSLLVDSQTPVKPNGDGKFLVKKMPMGLHTIDYDMDQLSLNFTPTTANNNFKIEPQKVTIVQLGLMVTPGTCSGTIKLKDGNGKPLNAVDTIVVLKDADTGKEVKFTYADANGHYTISEIPPGNYEVYIDLNQVKTSQFRVQTASHKFTVPLELEGFYDKTDLDFDVIQLMKVQSSLGDTKNNDG